MELSGSAGAHGPQADAWLCPTSWLTLSRPLHLSWVQGGDSGTRGSFQASGEVLNAELNAWPLPEPPL